MTVSPPLRPVLISTSEACSSVAPTATSRRAMRPPSTTSTYVLPPAAPRTALAGTATAPLTWRSTTRPEANNPPTSRPPRFGTVTYTFTCRVAASTVALDRKSTRLNSSHDQISYAVFCLKKKKKQTLHLYFKKKKKKNK